MSTQVKLPNGDYVNPRYVTSIRTQTFSSGKTVTYVWVVGNSGYGTFFIDFDGDRRNELAKLINEAKEEA
jgi:hypothetical protein